MPRLTPLSTRTTGHHGDSMPPHSGGGGNGGGRDGDSMPDSIPNYGERLRHARMSLAIAMTPIVMLFVSFTAVYVIRRTFVAPEASTPSYPQSWLPIPLPWILLLLNTAILLASSVTIELARRAITRDAALAPIQSIPGVSLGDEHHFPWLSLTTILGLLFLAGQVFVWSKLSSHGFHLAGGTSVSFIYILTAIHGLHLVGGVVALLYANIASAFHRPVEARRIVVDIASWYWHCMTGLWIYILGLFWFVAQ